MFNPLKLLGKVLRLPARVLRIVTKPVTAPIEREANKMLQKLLLAFLKKGAYAAIALVIAFIGAGLANYQPDLSDPATKYAWAAIVAGLTGLVALLKRLANELNKQA